ncbi:hypothetical protein GCM10022251_19230 [Phytohabitans flavus]|uniref:Oligosaccharide repeat unit polymerase n=1 Tax=Phytohabitans flavus TaxID=1076124 RepID=A0A6F8XZE8_9ACTN|nr:hypothetical protein [Phytohabitans flavus]BCB79098.1 hypothetical protein Pflav_055080 [Phytohabitans flavus]
MTATERRLWSAAIPACAGVFLLLLTLDAGLAVTFAIAAGAVFAARQRMWALALCAAGWVAAFLAVRLLAGPYDSWAGPAVLPVLAVYVGAFLIAWVGGRRIAERLGAPAAGARPTLAWPSETRLRLYLLAVLAVAVLSAVLRFRGIMPPLLDDNPDAARQVLRERSNIVVGLLSEAWTLGMSISLLRALTSRGGRLALYLGATAVFTVGAALGASKNSVLVGLVPAIIAVLSVRGAVARPKLLTGRAPIAILLAGVALVGAMVFLGGQRTLAGTGTFEDEFRSRYGDNAITSSAGSLDLSLSSSVETFGRLWAQRETQPPEYGAYSLMFLGSRAEPLVGKVDLYAMTSELSLPYYMNTATFVAIPLLDYGPVGAAFFLALLGLAVGLAERRLEFSTGPAQQIARGFVVYFAVFGIYELYPFIYPTWLALVPGLWVLHRLGRAAT